MTRYNHLNLFPFESGTMSQKSILRGVAVAVAIVVAAGTSFGVRWWMKRIPPAAVIPESDWKPLEVAGRFKCLMPGTPEKKQQLIEGKIYWIYTVNRGVDDTFVFMYIDRTVDRRDREQGADYVLNQAAGRMSGGMSQAGGTESRRSPVTVQGYPSLEMVTDVPKQIGQALTQIVYAEERVFAMLCGGKGFQDGDPNVTRFFKSLEILKPEKKDENVKPLEPKAPMSDTDTKK
ncbi:hypothetical protein BH11PLA2_BH11PLA2_14890 [soil metagenome]